MTRDEAELILNARIKLEDLSCSCHINAPCAKCEGMPSDELYEEALKILGE